MIGKTSAAAANLVAQWDKKAVFKEYLAIVKGNVREDSFLIDAPLARDPHSEIKLKMNVAELGADGEPLYLPKSEILPSRTQIHVSERLGNYTVVRAQPHTGRQHQIRVHLWHLGHPIAGDKLYGTDASFFLRTMKEILHVEVERGIMLTRHALHAHKLGFRHPVSGEPMEFFSPFPEELADFLRKVGKVD